MQASSPNTQFGIEIECLHLRKSETTSVAYKDRAFSDIFDDDSTRQPASGTSGTKAVHDALSGSWDVKCSDCSNSYRFELSLNPLVREGKADYSNWTVEEDISVKLTKEEQDQFVVSQPYNIESHDVEISSRILAFHDTPPSAGGLHIHRLTAEDEVKAVYARLHETFNDPSTTSSPDHRLAINQSCSTHVHVGVPNAEFSLSTVRNIFSIAVACEKIFDSLHSARRIGGSILAFKAQDGSIERPEQEILEPLVYNMPLSAQFALDSYNRLKPGKTNMDRYPNSVPSLQDAASRYDSESWLKIIENAPNLTDLLYLQSGNARTSTVNFGNLVRKTADIEPTKTVEFRQHAGTLAADEALAWVEVCVRLIEFASSQSEEDVADLCAGKWAMPSHTVDAFLVTLGVSAPTRAHYAKVTASGVNNYSAAIQETELEASSSWPRGNVIDPLADHLIRDRCEQFRPDVVAARIRQKFTQGCYGRFSDDFLDILEGPNNAYGLSSGERESLTIGNEEQPPTKRPRTRK